MTLKNPESSSSGSSNGSGEEEDTLKNATGNTGLEPKN